MDASQSGAEFSQAKGIAFRFLKYRPRSEKEILDKLKQKGISQETTVKTIEFLRQTQLVDDALFARGWIASRLKKPFGLVRITRELKNKGISDEIIRTQMLTAYGNYDETIAALELARHRWTKYQDVPKLKAKKRIFDYLIRRGFRFEIAAKVLTELSKTC